MFELEYHLPKMQLKWKMYLEKIFCVDNKFLTGKQRPPQRFLSLAGGPDIKSESLPNLQTLVYLS